jgi:hypothetical protein
MMPENRAYSKIKPTKCPKCSSTRVARIQYGYPVISEEDRRKIDAGEIILGGCFISGDDPKWECADCGTQIWKSN